MKQNAHKLRQYRISLRPHSANRWIDNGSAYIQQVAVFVYLLVAVGCFLHNSWQRGCSIVKWQNFAVLFIFWNFIYFWIQMNSRLNCLLVSCGENVKYLQTFSLNVINSAMNCAMKAAFCNILHTFRRIGTRNEIRRKVCNVLAYFVLIHLFTFTSQDHPL